MSAGDPFDAALAALGSEEGARRGWVRIPNDAGEMTVERLSTRWGEARQPVVVHPGEAPEVYWDVAIDAGRHVVVTAELADDSSIRSLLIVEYRR